MLPLKTEYVWHEINGLLSWHRSIMEMVCYCLLSIYTSITSITYITHFIIRYRLGCPLHYLGPVSVVSPLRLLLVSVSGIRSVSVKCLFVRHCPSFVRHRSVIVDLEVRERFFLVARFLVLVLVLALVLWQQVFRRADKHQ